MTNTSKDLLCARLGRVHKEGYVNPCALGSPSPGTAKGEEWERRDY